MKFHALADLFPLLEGVELDVLAADIKTRGLLHPIVLYEEKILDGRNRWNACKAAKVEPRTETYRGKDPVGYVISANLHRRHLDESQRAMVAGRLATMEEGRPSKTGSIDLVSQPAAAKLLNVSVPSVKRAREVIEKGTPALVAAVDQGKLAVSAAATFAKKAPKEQAALLKHVLAGEKPQEAKRKVISEQAAAAGKLPETKFRVLYADPPWSYGNTMPEGTTEQRDHYPVMTLGELAALPVLSLAEENAVLFLWATSPILPEALGLAKTWGFTYKASFVWDKVKHNMGHYNSVRHEFLLVCVKGSCQPDVRQLFDSVVSVERTEHSRKPEEFRRIIDTIYPNGKRIELFARVAAPGWEMYGNEFALRA